MWWTCHHAGKCALTYIYLLVWYSPSQVLWECIVINSVWGCSGIHVSQDYCLISDGFSLILWFFMLLPVFLIMVFTQFCIQWRMFPIQSFSSMDDQSVGWSSCSSSIHREKYVYIYSSQHIHTAPNFINIHIWQLSKVEHFHKNL